MSLIALGPGSPRGFAEGTPSSIETGLYHGAAAALRLVGHASASAIGFWHDRRTVRWLADADDAVLRDLGIARSDIPRLVRHGRH